MKRKNLNTDCFKEYTDLQSQFRPSYYQFFAGCCQGTEKFRVDVYFEASEHSVQTADDNSKLTSTSF